MLSLTRHHSAEQGREAPGNVRQRHSGLAIVSSDVCGVTRVYPQTIFRPRKLRLAELIVGWHDFYFIPGHPNPTVASANRYLWLNYRVHLLRTRKQESKKTRSISNMHERKERFAQQGGILARISPDSDQNGGWREGGLVCGRNWGQIATFSELH